jgi:hypothetical protein
VRKPPYPPPPAAVLQKSPMPASPRNLIPRPLPATINASPPTPALPLMAHLKP